MKYVSCSPVLIAERIQERHTYVQHTYVHVYLIHKYIHSYMLLRTLNRIYAVDARDLYTILSVGFPGGFSYLSTTPVASAERLGQSATFYTADFATAAGQQQLAAATNARALTLGEQQTLPLSAATSPLGRNDHLSVRTGPSGERNCSAL